MASPDLRGYVDLGLFDRDPFELVNRAKTVLLTNFPDLVLSEGTTEMVLLEALALEVAELVYAINRLPGTMAEIQTRLFGIARSLGIPPSGSVTFALADSGGHTIPAGTRLRLVLNDTVLIFTTDADLVVAPALSSGTVTMTATSATSRANGTVVGTALDVVDSLFFVDSAAVAVEIAGGTDPETTQDWLSRAVDRFRSLTDTLVLPPHFTSAALQDPAVYRAITLDNWNIDGPALGHVTVAVAGRDGALLSTPAKAALEATLDGQAAAELGVHVIDATLNPVAVTTTVVRLASYTDGEVTTNVTAALEAYLDPDTWPWAATVRRNELLSAIDNAEGVDFVVSVDVPATDEALTGVAPLATAGAIVVNVDAP